MQRLGVLLLVAGTVVASLGGARLPEANWWVAGAGLAMLAMAVVTLRRSPVGGDGAGLVVRAAVIAERMTELVPRLDALVEEMSGLPLATITERLSELEAEFVRPLSDVMPTLMAELGAVRFAEVAGMFAGGERMLARAWSAAADKHRPEAEASLREGASRLRQALESLASDAGKEAGPS